MFLLSGEIHMKSPVNDQLSAVLIPGALTIMRHDAPEALLVAKHRGAFGETVVTGMRRPMTHIAHSFTETLVLSREDLMTVFAKSNQATASRIVDALLKSAAQIHRLRSMMTRFIAAAAPEGSRLRAAFTVQMAWYTYLSRVNKQHAPLAKGRPPPPKSAHDVFRNRCLDKMQAEVLARLDQLRQEVEEGKLGSRSTTSRESVMVGAAREAGHV